MLRMLHLSAQTLNNLILSIIEQLLHDVWQTLVKAYVQKPVKITHVLKIQRCKNCQRIKKLQSSLIIPLLLNRS